ncbi:MAG: ADP-ribosylglycohydrolase family protein [Planctomycetes bacterium]|nr:ADP-ribosylglycohydrolase family protein [Planctomycetota bacterium]
MTIEGEPAQATQLFTAMIATAFVERDLERVLEAGLAAVDPASEVRRVATDVRGWWKEAPRDWRATRRKIKDRYQRHGGGMRDRNGFELNTAATVAALLHGGGDLAETLRLAFNLGWDADNNAATAAAIVGVIRGRRWIDAQGWAVKDLYRNTTRDGMPAEELLSAFEARVAALAKRAIRERGGKEVDRGGRTVYRIRAETAANVEPLPRPLDRLEELRAQLAPRIAEGLAGAERDRARAAYLALCLGEAERLRAEHGEEWRRAVAALRGVPEVVRGIFEAPAPAGDAFRARATAEGLERPAGR